ncbi:MAG TPA: Rrf2 family transcriptional regulator [Bacillota bacterium]|nr:Rrf2 family transcriptional regulator [Bacillota bacterium]
MQIRKSAIYGLRLCKVLLDRQEPMTLTELGKAIDLPRGGVQQVMLSLVHAEIVSSRRGLRGGYMLNKRNVTVARIVAAFVDGICAEMDGDSKEEAAIRRKIGSCVTGALRRMKLDDI